MVDFETVVGVLEIRLERWVRGRVPDNSSPTTTAWVDNTCKDKRCLPFISKTPYIHHLFFFNLKNESIPI